MADLVPRSAVTLEACVDSVEGVRRADAAGADRIELCGQLELGGTTPSHGLVEAARAATRLPIHVLVRPRGGDFRVSPSELETMSRDLRHLSDQGVQGIVLGALDESGAIDGDTMSKLLAATELPVTFHRAFDVTPDPETALVTLLDLRRRHPHLVRLLTSGQADDPVEATPLLARLVERAADRLTLIIGGGLREGTIRQLAAATGAREFHFSASRPHPGAFEPGLDLPPRYTCRERLRRYFAEFDG